MSAHARGKRLPCIDVRGVWLVVSFDGVAVRDCEGAAGRAMNTNPDREQDREVPAFGAPFWRRHDMPLSRRQRSRAASNCVKSMGSVKSRPIRDESKTDEDFFIDRRRSPVSARQKCVCPYVICATRWRSITADDQRKARVVRRVIDLNETKEDFGLSSGTGASERQIGATLREPRRCVSEQRCFARQRYRNGFFVRSQRQLEADIVDLNGTDDRTYIAREPQSK
jgi:hypothetical protein